MKVKYFLRGLGIGILVTTLLLFAGTRKNENAKLTDKQIIERAKELGMLTKDEVSDYKMDKNLEDIKTSLSDISSPAPSKKAEVKQDKALKRETSDSTKSPDPSKKAEKENRHMASVKIETGMTSQSVARYLYQVNVIGNASDFNEYMKEHNVSQKIRAGEYEIPTDATYAEIVEIIT
ncbi:MltG/YceG/YrrL family protein [[Clostridium] polysaccharolyticum]|uniref:YceG-like family protein n=1 Tax=[Clostridium] polysaccharolyticum TaxID=29364 RepID=A0A1H9Y3A7_9FIRM|nr:endolytic transglycosylase MltG [[Clostridium] polysaccharolyticum]SES63290.1 YceG-like family protein [[Clostridium] polysaccharolyticum]